MDKIEGYVDHIVYRNEDNGYTVMSMVCEGEELTCVGSFQYISEGEMLEAEGDYTEHPMYGEQFQVKKYELKTPEDTMAIERYLGSGAIKGVGAALAARIVRRFKEDTLRIVEEEPERLAEIKGISPRKAREIAEQMEDKADMRRAMIFLQKYGISNTLGVKIYKQYGTEIYGVIQENPYKMADDIDGVGFKIADEIAARVGIHTDSDFRIKSGILYILVQAGSEGHTYLPQDELLRRTSELLGVEQQHIQKHIMDLAVDRRIICKEEESGEEDRTEIKVYGTQSYYLELNSARMLHDLNVQYETFDFEIEHNIKKIQEESEIELDEMQKAAVAEAVKNGVFILSGGPGTGKTTTINSIIRYFEREEMDIFLAAPTGRAAKRMAETTGYEAQTIHRLLELSGVPEEDSTARAAFERNEQNPLEADVIIIDEMSMVDIHLFHALLCAITVGTRLILVGDVNQLPSVGPGCVLKDIMDSGSYKVVILDKIFRQSKESDIVVNAHKINRGEEVVLNNKSKDFFFLKRQDANMIIRILISLVKEKLPPYVGAESFDIQVLTPMRKGILGVENLNVVLQQYLNPRDHKKAEKEYGSGLFREGDKVMQIKNNYQMEWQIRGNYGFVIDKGMGVFNGDMGHIESINEHSEMVTVKFDDDRTVEYSFKQLEELELAYAITIHKSQGSEYPAVVIPLLTGPRMLMNRNLIYTAVTRARKCVTLVGDEETFLQMIRNATERKRYSSLKERICELK